MGPTRTRTIKNKHAPAKSGLSNSKANKRSATDGTVKPRKNNTAKGTPPSKQVKESAGAALFRKAKKKNYPEAQLGIPKLNMITPVGVVKPKGKKKGKVFVDDRVRRSMLGNLVNRG